MSESKSRDQQIIFLASFLTIFAAGVGFGVRGAILGDWANDFSVVIILSSLLLDKLGYKPILMLAFLFHLASAVLTLSAEPVFDALGKDATFWCLAIGLTLFSFANGLCEAAVNPLVATLYPKQKTHYLNILHASWPGGLIVGGLLAYCFCGEAPVITKIRWEIPLGMYAIPVLLYGFMLMPHKLPQSEASSAGVSTGEMLSQFASPILLLLLLIHAMVGYVELGTDSWITNIMDNVVKEQAILLFVYTSALMFVLRFFAGPIVERINPLGLLTVSGVLGFVGLQLLSKADTVAYAFLAASVYGLGKTFLWPTMLGVVGERFPRGGAIVMGTMGGVGMLSAGLLGGPVIGYEQDYYASQYLAEPQHQTQASYVVPEPAAPLFFLKPISGLDGAKVGVLDKNSREPTDKDGAPLMHDLAVIRDTGKIDEKTKELESLGAWWENAKTTLKDDKPAVIDATIHGGREALKLTSYVPATMAVLYLLLVLYFRATGGYKAVHLETVPSSQG
jgi:MFS family permease